MIVDVHAHVIVPEITREAGGDEPWRPSVRWEDGTQIVELGGQAIRSATREFVRIERVLEEEASSGIDHVVLSPWVALLPYALDADDGLRATHGDRTTWVALLPYALDADDGIQRVRQQR